MSVMKRIIDVTRKPRICPVCKEGQIVPIIYGTGDYTCLQFLIEYRKEGYMGGDTIPRRAPMWACMTCEKRFRKVNQDGSDAPIKIRLLKNERRDGKVQINLSTLPDKDE